jgi:hypothetical protein
MEINTTRLPSTSSYNSALISHRPHLIPRIANMAPQKRARRDDDDDDDGDDDGVIAVESASSSLRQEAVSSSSDIPFRRRSLSTLQLLFIAT